MENTNFEIRIEILESLSHY